MDFPWLCVIRRYHGIRASPAHLIRKMGLKNGILSGPLVDEFVVTKFLNTLSLWFGFDCSSHSIFSWMQTHTLQLLEFHTHCTILRRCCNYNDLLAWFFNLENHCL